MSLEEYGDTAKWPQTEFKLKFIVCVAQSNKQYMNFTKTKKKKLKNSEMVNLCKMLWVVQEIVKIGTWTVNSASKCKY